MKYYSIWPDTLKISDASVLEVDKKQLQATKDDEGNLRMVNKTTSSIDRNTFLITIRIPSTINQKRPAQKIDHKYKYDCLLLQYILVTIQKRSCKSFETSVRLSKENKYHTTHTIALSTYYNNRKTWMFPGMRTFIGAVACNWSPSTLTILTYNYIYTCVYIYMCVHSIYIYIYTSNIQSIPFFSCQKKRLSLNLELDPKLRISFERWPVHPGHGMKNYPVT